MILGLYLELGEADLGLDWINEIKLGLGVSLGLIRFMKGWMYLWIALG